MNASSSNTPAGRASTDAAATVTRLLQELSALIARKATAQEVLTHLYWPDVVVAGEGFGQAVHGVENLRPLAVEYLQQMGTDCSFVPSEPVLVSGDLASSFVQVTCRYHGAQPDAHYCALYVWQRRGADWKVAHEQVCQGSIG